jgi:hypothetical protein
LVSGGVGLCGLAVPIVTTRMAESSQARAIRDARLDELREVVDAAAVALMAVREPEPEMRDGFEKVRQALPLLKEALLDVRQQQARLAARLGIESEIVRSYDAAHDALAELHAYWRAVVEGETPARDFAEANAAVSPAVSGFFSVTAAAIGPDREGISSSSSRRRRDTGSRSAG